MNNEYGDIIFTNSELSDNYAQRNSINLIYANLELTDVVMTNNLAEDICNGITQI
jgi:hypothetical protein